MILLAFVDTHGDPKALKEILRKSNDADLLICAGDMSTWGEELRNIFKQIEVLEKPMLIIPGNHEISEALIEVCQEFKYIIYLHKGTFRIDDYVFFGYGGGGFSQGDQGFEKVSDKVVNDLKPHDKLILITHAPPYGTTLDYLNNAGHVGNKSITEFIKKNQPILAISGHLHETSKAKDTIGKTVLVNPGPEGMLLKI